MPYFYSVWLTQTHAHAHTCIHTPYNLTHSTQPMWARSHFSHSCVIVRAKRFCRYFVFFCSHSLAVRVSQCGMSESLVGLRLHSNVCVWVCARECLIRLSPLLFYNSTTFQIVMIKFCFNVFPLHLLSSHACLKMPPFMPHTHAYTRSAYHIIPYHAFVQNVQLYYVKLRYFSSFDFMRWFFLFRDLFFEQRVYYCY